MNTLDFIVTTYNNSSTIKSCLKSIPDTIFDIPVHVVVSDDCSHDNTISLSRSVLQGRQFTILTSDINTGIGLNRQRAIDKTNSEYFVFLDADDHIETSKIGLNSYPLHPLADLTIFSRNIPSRQSKQSLFENELRRISRGEPQSTSKLFNAILSQSVCFAECWGIIFKRSIISKYSIRFIDLRVGEDQLFMLEYFSRANTWSFNSDLQLNKSSSLGISRTLGINIRDDYAKAYFKTTTFLEQNKKYFSPILNRFLIYNIEELAKWLVIHNLFAFTISLKPSAFESLLPHNLTEDINLPIKKKYSLLLDTMTDKYWSCIQSILKFEPITPICIWFATPFTFVLCEFLSSKFDLQISCVIDDNRSGSYRLSESKTIPIMNLEESSKACLNTPHLVVIVSDNYQLNERLTIRTKQSFKSPFLLTFKT